MRYRTAAAFRTALEEQLRGRAAKTGASLSRVRKHVVFDRLLARLVQAAPGRWVLKGALALDLRLGSRARATKDMDLGRADGEEEATADLLAAVALDLGDFFAFRTERSADLDEVLDGAAIRYRVRAELAGRLFEDVVVDVGFSRETAVPVETLWSFDLLKFSGIHPVRVPAIPLDQHVAEKVHAYTRSYGEGRSNTRVKDLVDIALIAAFCEVRAEALRQALDFVFETRSTHALPGRLPGPPRDWVRPYAALARGLDLPPALDGGFAIAAGFLDPVLAGEAYERWDSGQSRWV